MANLPLLPLIHSPQDIIFGMYIVARITGLFLVSPLLGHVAVPGTIKGMLVVFSSVLIGMVIHPQYRGPDAVYQLGEFSSTPVLSLALLLLTMAKEVAIGFLIGFIFSLIFEALLLAGQTVGVVIGFSIAELLDPVSNTPQSLLGNFFVITASLLTLAFDFHHVFLKVASESFYIVPLGHYHLPFEMLSDVTAGTSKIFSYSMSFGAIPYTMLLLVTMALGFMGRVMPEMNIFMVGFPLRIFIGYYGLIFAINYFPLVLKKGFIELQNLIGILLTFIGGGTGVSP